MTKNDVFYYVGYRRLEDYELMIEGRDLLFWPGVTPLDMGCDIHSIRDGLSYQEAVAKDLLSKEYHAFRPLSKLLPKNFIFPEGWRPLDDDEQPISGDSWFGITGAFLNPAINAEPLALYFKGLVPEGISCWIFRAYGVKPPTNKLPGNPYYAVELTLP